MPDDFFDLFGLQDPNQMEPELMPSSVSPEAPVPGRKTREELLAEMNRRIAEMQERQAKAPNPIEAAAEFRNKLQRSIEEEYLLKNYGIKPGQPMRDKPGAIKGGYSLEETAPTKGFGVKRGILAGIAEAIKSVAGSTNYSNVAARQMENRIKQIQALANPIAADQKASMMGENQQLKSIADLMKEMMKGQTAETVQDKKGAVTLLAAQMKQDVEKFKADTARQLNEGKIDLMKAQARNQAADAAFKEAYGKLTGDNLSAAIVTDPNVAEDVRRNFWEALMKIKGASHQGGVTQHVGGVIPAYDATTKTWNYFNKPPSYSIRSPGNNLGTGFPGDKTAQPQSPGETLFGGGPFQQMGGPISQGPMNQGPVAQGPSTSRPRGTATPIFQLPPGNYRNPAEAEKETAKDEVEQEIHDAALQTARLYRTGDLKKISGWRGRATIEDMRQGDWDVEDFFEPSKWKSINVSEENKTAATNLYRVLSKTWYENLIANSGKAFSRQEIELVRRFWGKTNQGSEQKLRYVILTNLVSKAAVARQRLGYDIVRNPATDFSKTIEAKTNELVNKVKSGKDLTDYDFDPQNVFYEQYQKINPRALPKTPEAAPETKTQPKQRTVADIRREQQILLKEQERRKKKK